MPLSPFRVSSPAPDAVVASFTAVKSYQRRQSVVAAAGGVCQRHPDQHRQRRYATNASDIDDGVFAAALRQVCNVVGCVVILNRPLEGQLLLASTAAALVGPVAFVDLVVRRC